MRAMISQPMKDKSLNEIRLTREEAKNKLEGMGYEFVNTLFTDYPNIPDDVTNTPLFYLAKSVEAMSTCDAVYFCKDWEFTKGCLVEHYAAIMYGLDCIYES